ncbi:MAG: hypothetical protein J7507_07695 [Pseudoxanthomonas sp.]|nr:hypothetical protein [Pseudoxanthomonas sp.]
MPRALALAGSVAVLLLAGRVLVGLPHPPSPQDDGPRVQLVFSAREPRVVAPPAPSPPAAALAGARSGVPSVPGAAPMHAAAPVPAAAPAKAAGPAHGALVLYGADGRLQIPATASDRWAPPSAAPPGSTTAVDDSAARRLLQRSNPVPSRETRFAKDWISDGDLADVTAQEIARAQRKIARFLLGRDIEHAQARASPEVRFNPARHERVADLGSEATGDAYKAAPIDYQPAPGLDGEASRRIREQVAALETSYGHCDRARLQRLMQPLLEHLDELQKAEAAYARGADPIRAEHMLPNVANGAYDMARRALWYADRQMAGCGA